MLCFYCTQTHIKLQSEFSREFLKIFARLPPLASAVRCGPHPRTPLATPVTANHFCAVFYTFILIGKYENGWHTFLYRRWKIVGPSGVMVRVLARDTKGRVFDC